MADINLEATASRLVANEDDSELTMYKKQAVNVVSFKFVYDKDGCDNKIGQFKPAMAHQVFGDSESIFGYRSLAINIYYLHNSAKCYVDIQSSGKIKSDLHEPDDIMQSLDSWLPENYTTDKDEFLKLLENEVHDKIYGSVLGEFKDQYECQQFPNENLYATYKVNLMDLSDTEFLEFHKKFETMIVWFIDAANFIDLEDERWMIFYVFEEFIHPKTKKLMRSPIGFSTVYKFYLYPDKVRARISQFFILPSHQRRGIGTHMYEIVAKKIREIPDIVDITVEEPTANFQKIRDISDSQVIYKDLKSNSLDIRASNQKKINEYMRRQKLSKRQCQRIFDILVSYKAKQCGPFEYNNYLNTIKQRFTNDVERETRAGKRFCALSGYTIEPADTKALVESEFKKYIEEISPTVKYLITHM